MKSEANKTGYVIIEVGMEYDDETYNPIGVYEHDGPFGTPRFFFADRAEALKLASDMNFKEVCDLIDSGDIEAYGYSACDIFGDIALDFLSHSTHTEIKGKETDTIIALFNEQTDEVKQGFVNRMETVFYVVKEVEVK